MNTSVYTSPLLSSFANPEPSKMTLSAAAPESKSTKRCQHADCKKKLGLLGFDCRCGHKFCSSHRMPDDHACTFDFREAAKKTLQAQLESCVAEKVTKI